MLYVVIFKDFNIFESVFVYIFLEILHFTRLSSHTHFYAFLIISDCVSAGMMT